MTYEEKKEWLRKQLRAHRQPLVGKVSVYWTDLSLALAELEKAWGALEFYADEERYYLRFTEDGTPLRDDCVDFDKGKRAREALNEESKTKHPGTSTPGRGTDGESDS